MKIILDKIVNDFNKFYTDYENKFCIHSKDAVIKNLIKANIIREDDGEYSFSYLYIYYYLVRVIKIT